MALNRNFLVRYRVHIAQVIFWSLLVYCFGYARITISPLHEAQGQIGAVTAFIGALIRSLSAGYISKNTYLASQGLYALSRNPLYFGSFIALTGVNIIIWNPIFAIVSFFLYAMTYIPTILAEEKGLAFKFGEQWLAFKKSTPRFFPAIWRLHAYRDINWSYQQWKDNGEYRGVMTIVIIVALLAWYGSV